MAYIKPLKKNFMQLTVKDLDIPKEWLNLPVFEGKRCEDVGWMLEDLITYYNTLIKKYEETDNIEYYFLLRLFGFAKQESEE